MKHKHHAVNELQKRGGTDLGTGKHSQETRVPGLAPSRAPRVKRHPGRAKGTKGY